MTKISHNVRLALRRHMNPGGGGLGGGGVGGVGWGGVGGGVAY